MDLYPTDLSVAEQAVVTRLAKGDQIVAHEGRWRVRGDPAAVLDCRTVAAVIGMGFAKSAGGELMALPAAREMHRAICRRVRAGVG